jgi:pimeloyl-ACP methyl ester carboxylesterase
MKASEIGSKSSTVKSRDGTAISYQSLGAGKGIIVVSGTLRSGNDYIRLARALAPHFAVHLMDRRGRGGSGPLGPAYAISKECDDLRAVQAATGAFAVFGHSYGGFVALETAWRSSAFSKVAVYEPGVSISGSIPMGWMPRFKERLASGDTRGAFVAMIRQSGFAPSVVARMPEWYVWIIVRMALRRGKWVEMESLLAPCLAEHEQEAIADDGTIDRYAAITASVLLLGGSKSPAFITTGLFAALQPVIACSAVEIVDSLDHFAPDEKAPDVIAQRLISFLRD